MFLGKLYGRIQMKKKTKRIKKNKVPMTAEQLRQQDNVANIALSMGCNVFHLESLGDDQFLLQLFEGDKY